MFGSNYYHEYYRMVCAAAAMQGLLANSPQTNATKEHVDLITEEAVDYADGLLKRLEETKRPIEEPSRPNLDMNPSIFEEAVNLGLEKSISKKSKNKVKKKSDPYQKPAPKSRKHWGVK